MRFNLIANIYPCLKYRNPFNSIISWPSTQKNQYFNAIQTCRVLLYVYEYTPSALANPSYQHLMHKIGSEMAFDSTHSNHVLFQKI